MEPFQFWIESGWVVTQSFHSVTFAFRSVQSHLCSSFYHVFVFLSPLFTSTICFAFLNMLTCLPEMLSLFICPVLCTLLFNRQCLKKLTNFSNCQFFSVYLLLHELLLSVFIVSGLVWKISWGTELPEVFVRHLNYWYWLLLSSCSNTP